MAVTAATRFVRFNTIGILGCAIAVAWAVCVWAELSGNAAALHHDALYQNGRPYWLSALVVLAAWQFMTAAMMLPSSLGLIRLYAATAGRAPDFPFALGLVSWAATSRFGRRLRWRHLPATCRCTASSTRGRGSRRTRRLIPAATLGLAALYQFTPLKDACLKACRHPGMYLMRHYRRGALNGLRLGFGHALYCLGCCWALMLVMFAAGVAHLAWMGVLAAIMFVEKATPSGNRFVAPVGAALGALAVIALVAPGAIPGL